MSRVRAGCRRSNCDDRLCSCRQHLIRYVVFSHCPEVREGLAGHADQGRHHLRHRSTGLPAVVHRRRPRNGKGFESAVAYAVADKLGYAKEDVKWVRVPFNAAIAPGPKTFDANLNEFSITDERKQAVDFSSPYFNVTQAVVAVKSSPAAQVKTLDGLKGLKLGAQVGTTSYTAAKAVDPGVAVFNNNDDAKAALSNGQIDALVLDLPTAFEVQSELTDGIIVGQLPAGTEKAEQFGIVLDKGSPLTACVSKAVDDLGNNGDLFKLQKVWLAGVGNAPVLS